MNAEKNLINKYGSLAILTGCGICLGLVFIEFTYYDPYIGVYMYGYDPVPSYLATILVFVVLWVLFEVRIFLWTDKTTHSQGDDN